MNEQILSPRGVLLKSRLAWIRQGMNSILNWHVCKHYDDDEAYDSSDDEDSVERDFVERGKCLWCLTRRKLLFLAHPVSWYQSREREMTETLDEFIIGMREFKDFVKNEPTGCLGKIRDFAIKTRDMYNESGDTINDVNNGITDDVTV